MKNYKTELTSMGERALLASRKLATVSTKTKNQCLELIAKTIENRKDEILTANEKDVDNGIKKCLSPSMVDRLRLTEARIASMAEGLRELIKLEDPVGEVLSTKLRPNGIEIKKVSVPIGVIGIIYEARPNVTVDAAGLCLKSGNAAILRGGSESINSNIILASCISQACMAAGLSKGTIQLLPWTDREAVNEMLKLDKYINLIIPRGGESLIRKVTEYSTIPVLKHYKGVCSIYVDNEADFEMASNIIVNAKCQRPGVCNAVENILINEDIISDFLPALSEKLSNQNVEILGDNKVCEILPEASKASEKDWSEEYLTLKLSIKTVSDIAEAVTFINRYGSGHSDSIITANSKNAKYFMQNVDSSTVYHNASTRFTDGFEFGMGAEIGISTDKLHARGPVGLKELNTYKYFVYGTGQIRE